MSKHIKYLRLPSKRKIIKFFKKIIPYMEDPEANYLHDVIFRICIGTEIDSIRGQLITEKRYPLQPYDLSSSFEKDAEFWVYKDQHHLRPKEYILVELAYAICQLEHPQKVERELVESYFKEWFFPQERYLYDSVHKTLFNSNPFMTGLSCTENLHKLYLKAHSKIKRRNK